MNGTNLVRNLITTVYAGLLLIFSCSVEPEKNFIGPDHGGNTTQTGNGKVLAVAGVLYEPDGSPASGARVSIHPLKEKGNIRAGDEKLALKKRFSNSETVFTDDQGRFLFDSLQRRNYLIEADKGESLFTLIEYVNLISNNIVHVEDTLKIPGSIKIVIDKQIFPLIKKADFFGYAHYKTDIEDSINATFHFGFGENKEGGKAYYGDGRLDSSGAVIFDNLPEGLYVLSATVDIQENETYKKAFYSKRPLVPVVSGQVTVMDTIRLRDMEMEKLVALFDSRYDSETGKMFLSWSKLDTSRLAGINIYQESQWPQPPVKISAAPATDTFFVDTGFWDFPRRPLIREYETYDTSTVEENNISKIPADTTLWQAFYVSYLFTTVDKAGNESWVVSSLWEHVCWKKEEGIPFLPDTLVDSLTYSWIRADIDSGR